MHDAAAEPEELTLGQGAVERLLAAQFPQWSRLPLRPVASAGTDHAMYRVGDDLAVRLPRVSWAVRTLQLEQAWLPRIAPHLPVETPVPVAVGEPTDTFPWPWTVARWVRGANPVAEALADPTGLATDLAVFVTAMRGLDAKGAPPTVWPAPLHEEDPRVRAHLPRLADVVDIAAVAQAWEDAIHAPPSRRRTWIHGDLAAGNLLLREDRLRGVIDFSAMGLGDPASDLRAAWNLLPVSARPALRDGVDADDAEWSRARGWALLQAVAQLARFSQGNAWLADTARRTLSQIADEIRSGQP